VKIYRQHYCTRQHRSWRTLAKCIWPRAVWVEGDGPYAVLAWCNSARQFAGYHAACPSVSLHADVESAEDAKRRIDLGACGGMCNRRHEIIHLAMEARP
jgi:hypothetical protein